MASKHCGHAVWQVGLYLRLSREDGNDESLSITNQRSILLEYIAESFQEPYKVVDEYVDDGKTGTDIARPEFKRMIADVEAGRVNCIIVKDLKRFMRNHGYQALYLEQIFPKNDTRFITVSEPRLDTFRNPNAVYGFDVPMHGIMNDRYAQGTSEAVKRTFANKIKQGKFIGAFCPYGYMKDPADKNKLLIDEQAARVVRDIFMWFLEGVSKRAICLRLNGYGIPNPSKYKRLKGLSYSNPHSVDNDGLWNPSTITKTLKNEAYIGTMVQGKQRVVSYKIHERINISEDQWVKVPEALPAIISAEQFANVQALLAKNTRVTKESGTLALLSGYLKCSDCKKAMRRKHGGNARLIYYVCRTHSEKGVCSPRSIKAEILENAVFKAVRSQICLAANLAEIIADVKANPARNARTESLEAQLDAKRRELERASAINDDLYLDWKSGIIDRASYDRLKEKTGRQMKALAIAIGKMEEELMAGISEASAHPVLEALAKHGSIDRLDRQILAALVDTIYVHENSEITILFKYDDNVKKAVSL